MSASKALQFFRDSTCLQAMPDEALQRLGDMAETAEDEMRNITKVMLGIGCLISADANQDHFASGSLQNGSEVSAMLFSLAESMQAQIETLHIAANSDAVLKNRQHAQDKEISHA